VKDPVLVDAMFRDLLELMRFTKRGMDQTAARRACNELAEAFCVKWAAQDTFVQYFRKEWMPKLGVHLLILRCPCADLNEQQERPTFMVRLVSLVRRDGGASV
jgi:hypothetical protein